MVLVVKMLASTITRPAHLDMAEAVTAPGEELLALRVSVAH